MFASLSWMAPSVLVWLSSLRLFVKVMRLGSELCQKSMQLIDDLDNVFLAGGY